MGDATVGQRDDTSGRGEQTDVTAFASALSALGHEFRTPLTTISGAMDVLQRMSLPDDQRRLVESAARASHHLELWIDNVLAALRPEQQRASGTVRPINLAKEIHEAAAAMRLATLEKTIRVELCVDDDLAALRLCDQRTVRQLLLNVLDAALRFCRGGVLEITAYTEGEEDVVIAIGGPNARWSAGAAATAQRLLKRQAQDALLRDGGAAMGLLAARGLAAHLNGHIILEQPYADAVTFVIRFSAARAAAPSPDDASPSDRLAVLVVEDNAVNQRLIRTMLEGMGHAPAFAESGEAALLHLEGGGAVDVVLMDLHMPGMDGFTAAEAIRARPDARGGLPIIAITADVADNTAHRAQEAGMDAVLAKPINVEQLAAVLSRVTQTC